MKMFSVLGFLSPYATWFLRISLASVFLYHGLGKVGDISGFADMADLNFFVALLVTLMEIGGGLLVLAGGFPGFGKDWMTRCAGLLLIPPMLGAIFMVHLENGWDFMNGGMEFQFVLLMLALYFAAVGNQSGEE